MTSSNTDIGLYLEIDAGDGAMARLQAAFAVAPLKAVLIRPGHGGQSHGGSLQALVGLAQSYDAAALIEADARLARSLGADGVHLTWTPDVLDAYAEARKYLGAKEIVGAAAGTLRDDAMSLGEAGADYVGFAPEPDAADPLAARLERVAWWAELFEVPCVALRVASAEDADALVRAGADFLGIQIPPGLSPPDVADRVRMLSGLERQPAVSKSAAASRGER